MTKYFLSCAAAGVAETVTYPLDIIKTRLQLQNELNIKSNINTITIRPTQNGMFQIAINLGLYMNLGTKLLSIGFLLILSF